MPVLRRSRWLAAASVGAIVVFLPALAAAETITADTAVQLAAARNPNLKAALLDVEAADLAVVGERNARVPVFVAGATGEYSENIGTVARTDAEAIRANAGVVFKTDLGTTIETGVQTDVVWRNQTAGTAAGPTYGASVYLTARQPLLRGAGSDVVLAPLVQAEAARTQAERQQELEASRTALSVLSAYWELWYADRAVEVQERALAVAKKQLADAKVKQSELGTGTKVDVLQFTASLASVQEGLSQARTARATRAIALGELLGMAPHEAVDLETTTALPTLSGAPSTEALTKSALSRSKELASMRAQIDSSEARVTVAKDADKPRLDAFASASMGGVWASHDGYSGLDLPGGRPAFTVLGGIDLEIPLGESRSTSEAARAQVQLDAARQRYQARVDAIGADVGSLALEVNAAEGLVELATVRAEVAEELAEAERARLALGTTTSLNVVQAEQSLREAELRMLRSLVDQASKQYALEHEAGALLDRYGSAFDGRSS